MTTAATLVATPNAAAAFADSTDFFPTAPQSFREAGLDDNQVEALLLKSLLSGGPTTGRNLARQTALPFRLVEPTLQALKHAHLVILKSATAVGDYVYELTEEGAGRAKHSLRTNAYCGAAPVTLADYIASVEAQSVRGKSPTLADLRRAFGELVLGDEILAQLGEAIHSGLGFMLYGPPGNGKTSIAERVTAVYGDAIWIPRAITAGGEVMRVFDPTLHEELPVDETIEQSVIDHRWAPIRRPTIVVGGELTLAHFSVAADPATGDLEAPLQIKSNCGTLVIDDLGRQQVEVEELLNRWVTPLEKRVDHLMLASGRKFAMPFDGLVVFSTNLAPRELVDEAFLRRIPYKIAVLDPTPEQFREVIRRTAARLEIACPKSAVDYLVDEHYEQVGRAARFCHARDLLAQIQTACRFRNVPPAVTPERIDSAVSNYFAM
jgi:predicted ATPase with chaperone activity